MSMEDSLFASEASILSDSLMDAARLSRQTSRSYCRTIAQPPQRIASSPHETSTYYHRYPKKAPLHFDLNAADSIDLEQLRGIGPTFARRIIRYRERLGGFANVEQLKEVYGMTVETYEAVAPHLSVNPAAIKRLNPNTASLQQLKAHPYLDYYQARAIVAWREKGHHYDSANDLHLVSLLDDSAIAKMEPYFEY